MWEDWLLIVRFNRGDEDAFQRIYLKYREDLLKVAIRLLFDQATAEDVLHDVFVNFARQAGSFQLRTRLKAYLAVCVANRARDVNRRESYRDSTNIETLEDPISPQRTPDHPLVERERVQCLEQALAVIVISIALLIVWPGHRGAAWAINETVEALKSYQAVHIRGIFTGADGNRGILSTSLMDVHGAQSWDFEFDLETKLPVRMRQWDNLGSLRPSQF